MRIHSTIINHGLKGSKLKENKPTDNKVICNNNLLSDSPYGRYIAFTRKKIQPVQNCTKIPMAEKLQAIRKEMKALKLDALFIASNDDYLNEIVGKCNNQRQYISDFTGSKGEVIITQDSAHLFVDSRYHIQADHEVDSKLYTVEKVGLDKNGNITCEDEHIRISEFLKKFANNKPFKIGYDPNKISIKDITYIKHLINKVKQLATFVPTEENLVDKIRGGKPVVPPSEIRSIPDTITGESTISKLDRLRAKLEKDNKEACVITNLYDIAYLTNLRGDDTPCSSTFNAKAIFNKGNLTVFCDHKMIPEEVKTNLKGRVEFLAEKEFETALDKLPESPNKPKNISFYQDETSAKVYNQLRSLMRAGIKVEEFHTNPVTEMRAIKNDVELHHYTNDLNAADRALNEVMIRVNDAINKDKRYTEKDLEIEVEKAHKRNGGSKLSFSTIPSAGSSTEEAHYMTANPNKVIKKGDIVLVDTGAFYKAGLSTDLTRTWIAGGNEGIEHLKETNPEKLNKIKRMYSIVLQTILKVMHAELPPDSTGKVIERLCSRTYEEYNLPIEYGWGHGVGIHVHEFPPYIDSCDHGYWDPKLKEGMTFAIEPGYYEKDFGGVRLENVVTVKKHHDEEKANKGWHEIECLTYTPIETELLDPEILTKEELKLIEKYNQKAFQNVNS